MKHFYNKFVKSLPASNIITELTVPSDKSRIITQFSWTLNHTLYQRNLKSWINFQLKLICFKVPDLHFDYPRKYPKINRNPLPIHLKIPARLESPPACFLTMPSLLLTKSGAKLNSLTSKNLSWKTKRFEKLREINYTKFYDTKRMKIT